MKVIIVEASGKIDREVDKDVSASHEVVRVGAASGDVRCDYTDAESVRSMFETVGAYDALVAGAGKDVRFRLFEELVDDYFRYGFERKFLSQIRLLSLGATDDSRRWRSAPRFMCRRSRERCRGRHCEDRADFRDEMFPDLPEEFQGTMMVNSEKFIPITILRQDTLSSGAVQFTNTPPDDWRFDGDCDLDEASP